MKIRKKITQTKIINVIFLLYLNLIIQIIAQKQFDKYSNLPKNLNMIIENNLNDLVSRYNKILENTTFFKRHEANIQPNSISHITKENPPDFNNFSPSKNISINLNEKLMPLSKDTEGHRISSFIQTSLLNKNDTLTPENNGMPNHNHNTISRENTQKSSIIKKYNAEIKPAVLFQTTQIPPKRTKVNSTFTKSIKPDSSATPSTINNKTQLVSKSPQELKSSQTNPNTKKSKGNRNSTSQNKPISNSYHTPSNNTHGTITTSNNANKNINTKSNCTNNCSGKGICVNGNCFCLQGFTTEDCSMTYKDYAHQGIKLEPMIKWLIIVFFGVFVVTMGILIWVNYTNSKAGDYLELD